MMQVRPFSHYTTPPPISPRWVPEAGASTALAVTLDEVKTFLKIPLEDDNWNAEFEGFIRLATLTIETHLSINLVERTLTATLPTFFDNIRIDARPFSEVTAIEYVDPDTGGITTLDSKIYHALPTVGLCGTVFRADGAAWPSVAKRWDAVRITATAGFTDETLPAELRHALLMTVAALDSKRGDERESGGSDVTVYAMKNARGGSVILVEAKALIAPWRLINLAVA